MSEQRHRTDDEACVSLLWETSPVGVRARVLYEERYGPDAYACEPLTWRERQRDPRDVLRACAREECPSVFFATATAGGMIRRYCSQRCQYNAWYRRTKAVRRVA